MEDKKQQKIQNKEKQSQQPTQVTQPVVQVNWETVYKNVLILIILLLPFFVNDIFKFQQFSRDNNIKYYGLEFIIQAIIAGTILYGCKMGVRKLTYNYFLRNIRKQYVGQDREFRAKKLSKWFYDIIYYTGTTVYCLIYFWDENWNPFINNHHIRESMVVDDWPSQPKNKYVDLFYIVQFGNHLYSTFDLVVFNRAIEPKFFEWVLHHFVACTLIFYSAYFNLIVFGLLVLQVHDIADTFVAFFKLYSEFEKRSHILFYLNAANMEIIWFYTRLWLFPTRIILPAWFNFRCNSNPEWDIVAQVYGYQVVMMLVLLFLHFYWFGIMMKMTYSNISKLFVKKKFVFHNDFDFQAKVLDEKSKVQ